MESPDLALLQTPKGVRLLEFTDAGIRAHSTGLARCERYAWLGEHRVVVLTRRRGNRSLWRQISILQLDGDHLRTYVRIETPIPAADVTVLNGLIVIGGDSASASRVWWIHPDERRWRPLEMPADLRGRKAVDALATDGKVLVAIDNIEFPKWMFRYVPDPSEWMRLERVAQMRTHGTYEKVLSASSGDTQFAVHSATIGSLGTGRYLCTYRFDDLSPCESVELGLVSHDAPRPDWEYCMQGDALWMRDKQQSTTVIRRRPTDNVAISPEAGARGLSKSREGRPFSVSLEGETISWLD